ncbi:MAG: translation initiation factor IF-2, partial [Cyanobacteria bacterium K_DeepCast_35m_m1_288]|nr:translation initiation factor IF-2 [Cyanobacteria bacterium K_DeepCast_35m_m1_288]
MTSSGKVRIYELSKDLGLENKDVLDAAEKLSIAAKSHSSSISDDEAARIRSLIKTGGNGSKAAAAPAPAAPPQKAILSVKKAPSAPAPAAPQAPKPAASAPAAPVKPAPVQPPAAAKPAAAKPVAANPPVTAPARPAAPAPAAAKPAAPAPRPAAPAPQAAKPVAPPARPAAPVAPPARPAAAKPAGAPARPGAPAPGRPAPAIVSRAPAGAPPARKPAPPSAATPARPVAPPQRPAAAPPRPGGPAPSRPAAGGGGGNKPQLVGRPQSGQGGSRPAPPSGRPSLSQRPGMPTRPGAPAPVRAAKPGTPPPRPQVELVGKPIRRDTNAPSGGNRPAPPTRPGMPGMRKPVAPGELMQLQKPGARPAAAPPRRPGAPGAPTPAGVGAPGGDEAVRPTATPPSAPRRPNFRAPQPPAGGRPRRPDWDDSAKLEALRSRSPQKQRQKVHIIGENDDALTAETGGFAGEQEAVVLQASLARPAKPKAAATAQRKPTAVTRKRKKETTRQRQRRRAMELRAAREAKQQRPEMLVVPEGNLTVQELADRLGVDSSEIIKSLFFKGIIATVTQTLDLSAIETVSDEFGVPVLEDDVEAAAAKTVEMIEESDLAHLIRRPPVVTVMGHVDHGKTSLLDSIRKTRVTAGEAGGITQHIGAYQVEVSHAGEQRKITFLDTPGHEAFTAMRARGTKVTDVAVLVVAADDGVRPQTLEAISHARAAKVPILVAINKIDKEGASPDRVKQELSSHELVAEDWGGNTVMVPVSAIKGENIDKLLEMILLVSEVEDLQANPDRMAKGTVIEAHLDKAKGPVATLLIQNGTLRTGDVLAAGPILGKVRAMVDDNGKRVKEAGPSYAVEALGFSEVPTAGDEFEVYPDEKSARAVVGDRATEARATRLAQQMASRRVSLASMSGQASEGELKELNLILKADVQGSVEAILGSLEQLPRE